MTPTLSIVVPVWNEERRTHNKGVDLAIRLALLKLQAPLQKLSGIQLRGGDLVDGASGRLTQLA